MDHQIGIAPDGRGKVGIAGEVQAEMADIVGRIDGLHLAAQDDLIDDLGMGAFLGLDQEAVEPVGARGLTLGPVDADGGQKVGQRLDLFLTRRVVDPVDQGGAFLALGRGLQRLGGADIGLDHELFDQAVGGQAFARADGQDLAFGADLDLALGAFNIQRRAAVPGLSDTGIGGPQGPQDRLQQRAGHIADLAVNGRLGVLIGQLGGRAHQAADKFVADLVARAVEDHAHGQTGAVLALAQAAKAVG